VRRGRHVLRRRSRRGFDLQELRKTAGFGLLSIRHERVELGGRMKIMASWPRSVFRLIVGGEEPQDRA
jgi:hypothetical protein